MSEAKKSKFERECAACEASTGVSFGILHDKYSGPTKVVEDDGALLISKRGIVVYFNIDQDRTLKEQNERITKVLVYLKMEKWLKEPYVLHSEDDVQREDEEENGDYECPHCGRRHD